MSSLLRVRVSSFLAGVAVAGTAAVIWLRDDVRRSFETIHTHVRPTAPRPCLSTAVYDFAPRAVCEVAPYRLSGPARTQTEGFSSNLDRRVQLLEHRVALLEDSKGAGSS